jgi:hypothetical protein
MRFPRCALVAIGAVFALSGVAQVTGLTRLKDLKDRARPLLIFAPKPDDPQLQIQVRTLNEHAAETHDRDLVPIALPYNNPSPTPAQLTPTDAEAARRHFHVNPGDFAVILIGKDGGSKLRSDKPLTMEKLNETIDAMPMRQDEMKSKQGSR